MLAESGVGWLPYFLARMDMEWENLRDEIDYAPSVPPSELFRRQVIATFEQEQLADRFIPYLGADSCMWASDYPHTDSTFPESRRAIEESLGSLPARGPAQDHVTTTARPSTGSAMPADRPAEAGAIGGVGPRGPAPRGRAGHGGFYRALGLEVTEAPSWSRCTSAPR